MHCILHFEDHKTVVDQFAEEHLWPRLEETGKTQQTEIQWVPYMDPRNPQLPAREAQQRIIGTAWERVALVVDMAATPALTPRVEFGMDVLSELAQLLYPQAGGVALASLLSDRTRLTCALTMFTGQFKDVIGNRWPQQVANTITFVEPDPLVRNVNRDTDAALVIVRSKPRPLVVASRLERAEWLAALIAKWL